MRKKTEERVREIIREEMRDDVRGTCESIIEITRALGMLRKDVDELINIVNTLKAKNGLGERRKADRRKDASRTDT